MSDEFSVSYSHSATDGGAFSPQAQTSDAPLVAFADCEIIPIDPQKSLVINRLNGKQKFFQPPVVEALKTCTLFDTTAGHAQRICATDPGLRGQENAVRGTLDALRNEQFLLDVKTIQAQLQGQKTGPLPPSRVFVITCDRPDAVTRLLESMLRTAQVSSHEKLFLIDDSRLPENQDANREAVESFNIRSATNMTYFGPQEQNELLAELIAKLPDAEEGIRFLIDPQRWVGKKTFGRSRTLALLLSVGRRAVVLDDDILCEAVRPPLQEDGICFTGRRQAAFYPDLDTLMGNALRADVDPISGQLTYLGESLGYALQHIAGGEIDPQWFAGANAAMLNELRGDTPVLITQCGSWGDPGTGTAHWALHLGEESIERLASAPHGMAQALENRLSWFGCPRPTLHKMAFMSQMTGIDNSHLLPPYFPAFRGEDLLFASMVEAMYHHGAVLEYDWSVPHLPMEDRGDRGLREPIAGSAGIVLFTRYLVERIDYKDASDPQRRLMALAEDARRIADRSDADLLLDYRREQAKGQAQLLFGLMKKHHDAKDLPSQNWQAYLNRAVEEVEKSIVRTHSPKDIPGVDADASEAALLVEFRAMARGWADAIQHWPSIRQVAEDLRG